MKYRFGSIIALPISIQKYSQKVAGIVSSPELILHPGTSRADDPGSALIVIAFYITKTVVSVYVLPWTPRTTTNGEHVKHTKMPTQSKKSVSITTSERPAKPKKKKKKESGRNSRNSFSKTPTSGVDSSSEGLF